MHELEKYIRDIPDFPKPGIIFKDITPLLKDPHGFQRAIEILKEQVEVFRAGRVFSDREPWFCVWRSIGFCSKQRLNRRS